MATPLTFSDLTRGLEVSFAWGDGVYADSARQKGIRPLGRVVTKEDLPYMGCGPVGIQLLDDPLWVLDPKSCITRGKTFFRVESDSGTPTLSHTEYLHYADKAVVDDFGNLVPVDF